MGLPEQDDTPSRYNLKQQRGREDGGAHPRACCLKTLELPWYSLGIRFRGRVEEAPELKPLRVIAALTLDLHTDTGHFGHRV